MSRLVSVGNIVVDILAYVPALPAAGGDVVADDSAVTPGGSFNTLVAAARQGLPSAYGGASGTGPFGDLVRAALRNAGIEVLLPAAYGTDTGYDVAIVEPDGERRFVTAFGAEANLTSELLGHLALQPDDLVHVSGYGLLPRTNAEVLPPWLLGLTADHLVLLDPGPLVEDIPAGTLRAVLERADWLSCNAAEAQQLTGLPAPEAARQLTRHGLGVVIRLGPRGCLVSTGQQAAAVPGFRTPAVDTTGAGDAHVGAFMAAIAAGHGPVAAARRANACAALAIARRGPATAPTLAEVNQLLAGG